MATSATHLRSLLLAAEDQYHAAVREHDDAGIVKAGFRVLDLRDRLQRATR